MKDTTKNSTKRKHQTLFCEEIFKFKSLNNYFKTEDNYCLICDRHEFDIIHFLTVCEGTRKMKMMLFREDTDEIRRKLRIHYTLKHHKHHLTHAQILIWCLWLMRNQLAHEEDRRINTKQIGKIRETVKSITQYNEYAHLHWTLLLSLCF